MAYAHTLIGCCLHNLATDRYHPIIYRPAPLPGGSDLPRYKSSAHHTEGLETLELAKTEMTTKMAEVTFWGEKTPVLWTEIIEPWSGEGIPAYTAYFDDNGARTL